MNSIVKDCVQFGRGLSCLMADCTGRKNLLTLVQISRPNWPLDAHRNAVRFLRSCTLRHSGEFPCDADFLDYLDKVLSKFNQHHPVRPEAEMADELTVSRWEARWQRMRQRKQPVEVRPAISATPILQQVA